MFNLVLEQGSLNLRKRTTEKRTTTGSLQISTNIYETNTKTKLVVKKELTDKNPVETHEGGLGQDDLENKQKIEEAYGAGANILD